MRKRNRSDLNILCVIQFLSQSNVCLYLNAYLEHYKYTYSAAADESDLSPYLSNRFGWGAFSSANDQCVRLYEPLQPELAADPTIPLNAIQIEKDKKEKEIEAKGENADQVDGDGSAAESTDNDDVSQEMANTLSESFCFTDPSIQTDYIRAILSAGLSLASHLLPTPRLPSSDPPGHSTISTTATESATAAIAADGSVTTTGINPTSTNAGHNVTSGTSASNSVYDVAPSTLMTLHSTFLARENAKLSPLKIINAYLQYERYYSTAVVSHV